MSLIMLSKLNIIPAAGEATYQFHSGNPQAQEMNLPYQSEENPLLANLHPYPKQGKTNLTYGVYGVSMPEDNRLFGRRNRSVYVPPRGFGPVGVPVYSGVTRQTYRNEPSSWNDDPYFAAGIS